MDRLFGRKAASPSSASSTSSPPASSSSSAVIGPPPLLASDPAYAEAILHLNNALRLEDSGAQVNTALEEYDIGLQMLLGLLRRLPKQSADQSAEKANTMLRGVIDRYMTRAEQLKQRKVARENGSSSNNSGGAGPIHPAMMRAKSSGPQHPAALSSRAASSAASSSASPPSVATPAAAAATKSNLDPALRTAIENEILVSSSGGVTFANIIGMENVKEALKEMVILPSLRPDLFTGIRAPPKGLLLYGPPGNGKSFVAAAVAAESHATFFSISAATLVSKHLGEGERLVRALFTVARERSPSIIFVDEIDSIMSRRSSEEHEASRRLKTEFFIQFDGASQSVTGPVVGDAPGAGRIIVLAATNCPELLDEALIRRLSRRIYIPCPSPSARSALLSSMLSQPSLNHQLTDAQLKKLVTDTEGYSNSDLKALVGDAALGPLRSLTADQLLATPADRLPPVRLEHFTQALHKIRPSVSKERLLEYEAWSKQQDGAR